MAEMGWQRWCRTGSASLWRVGSLQGDLRAPRPDCREGSRDSKAARRLIRALTRRQHQRFTGHSSMARRYSVVMRLDSDDLKRVECQPLFDNVESTRRHTCRCTTACSRWMAWITRASTRSVLWTCDCHRCQQSRGRNRVRSDRAEARKVSS